MKDSVVTGLVVGTIIGFVLGMMSILMQVDQWVDIINKEVMGHTVAEIREMKKVCEASLPRDKFCKVEIIIKEED